MIIEKSFFKIFNGTCLLIIIALICTACGTRLIRGEPPVLRMTEIVHHDQKISLQLNIRNLNGVNLKIQAIDLTLTIDDEEREDGHKLFAYDGPAGINIVANGTEFWSIEVEESETSREMLDSLENGDVMSLAYTLKGSVKTEDEGSMRFEYEGHIYPLPGKPGHFR